MAIQSAHGIDRRNFVAGASVGVAMAATATAAYAQADAAIPAVPYPGNVPTEWDYEADVVVVGGGAGGLWTAKAAQEAGASVILIDKHVIVGGDMNINEGGIHAAGTSVQKAAGMEDDPEAWAAKWWSLEKGVPNKDLLYATALQAPKAIEYFIEHGIEFSLSEAETFYAPEGILRNHLTSTRNGRVLTEVLEQDLLDRGVTIMTETRATSILRAADGHVFGVEAIQNGQPIYIGGKALVFATGDAWRNEELIARYQPETSQYLNQSASYATGDGFIMFQNAGAAFARYRQYDGPQAPFLIDPDGITMHIDVWPGDFTGKNAFIYVNDSCKREIPEFACFTNYPAKISSPQFLIFDDEFFNNPEWLWGTGGTTHDMVQAKFDEGLIVKADTIEELCSELGLDPKKLQETIDSYNNGVAAGGEDSVGRDPATAAPIVNGPFYGALVRPCGKRLSMNPDVNSKLEVRDTQGDVIPGLYASGRWWLMRTVEGDTYPGGGTGMATCFGTGQVAGTNAAEYALSLA